MEEFAAVLGGASSERPMSDEQTSARLAEYLKLAEQMRVAADRAFDPTISAAYLALASKWVRLAEQTQRSLRYIDRTGKEPEKGPEKSDGRN